MQVEVQRLQEMSSKSGKWKDDNGPTVARHGQTIFPMAPRRLLLDAGIPDNDQDSRHIVYFSILVGLA